MEHAGPLHGTLDASGLSGVCWKLPLSSCPPFEHTTGEFVETETFRSLVEFLKRSSPGGGDASVCICIDSPGMGKTRTVGQAAAATRSPYVRFNPAAGSLRTAKEHINTALRALAETAAGGVVPPADAERVGVSAWTEALAARLGRCERGLRTACRDVGLGAECGVEFSSDSASARASFDAAVDRLLATVDDATPISAAAGHDGWAAGAAVVLHFDEIQKLLPAGVDFPPATSRQPPRALAPAEYQPYLLVWFAAALDACARHPRLKPCITGIGVDCLGAVRAGSGLQPWPLPALPHFTPLLVQELLLRYLHFDDPHDLVCIASAIQGCPRAVQFFLLALHRNSVAVAAGRVGCSHSWHAAVDAGYALWSGSGHCSTLRGRAGHAAAVEEALLSVCYPDELGSGIVTAEGVPAAVFDLTDVPRAWVEAANCGMIRLRGDGGKVAALPAHPYLSRYIRTKCSGFLLDTSDCIGLAVRARASPLGRGATGRGNAFELAVAAELCQPSSPLLWRILTTDALKPLGLRPRIRPGAGVLPGATSDDLKPTPEPDCVLLLYSGPSATTWSDIAVPIYVASGDPDWLLINVIAAAADPPVGAASGACAGVDAPVPISHAMPTDKNKPQCSQQWTARKCSSLSPHLRSANYRCLVTLPAPTSASDTPDKATEASVACDAGEGDASCAAQGHHVGLLVATNAVLADAVLDLLGVLHSGGGRCEELPPRQGLLQLSAQLDLRRRAACSQARRLGLTTMPHELARRSAHAAVANSPAAEDAGAVSIGGAGSAVAALHPARAVVAAAATAEPVAVPFDHAEARRAVEDAIVEMADWAVTETSNISERCSDWTPGHCVVVSQELMLQVLAWLQPAARAAPAEIEVRHTRVRLTLLLVAVRKLHATAAGPPAQLLQLTAAVAALQRALCFFNEPAGV